MLPGVAAAGEADTCGALLESDAFVRTFVRLFTHSLLSCS